MPRLTPSLLALLLAAAPVAASADEFLTSRGPRTLPRLETLKGDAQLEQVEHRAEEVVWQLLQDVSALEAARGPVSEDAGALNERIRKANAELAAAKSAFDQMDQKYRADLASFEQSQVALEGEIQRQRADAAVLEALPSAQRDYAQVSRLNTWAQELATKRSQLDAERNRLLADHDRVEAERARVAKMYADTEQRLKEQREGTVGRFDALEGKRVAAYRQLRDAARYHESLRVLLAAAVAPRAIGHSAVLEQAKAKLAALDARQIAR